MPRQHCRTLEKHTLRPRTEHMDQIFVPSKRRVRRLAPMLIADRQAHQQEMEIVMSTISTTPALSQAFAGNSCTTRLAAILKRWWMAYLTWRFEQTAIAQLAALSDRELKDIGVRRCEIENAVRHAPKCEHALDRYY
jgi:uncharacterized protein YjiS (DUF1127 family)